MEREVWVSTMTRSTFFGPFVAVFALPVVVVVAAVALVAVVVVTVAVDDVCDDLPASGVAAAIVTDNPAAAGLSLTFGVISSVTRIESSRK